MADDPNVQIQPTGGEPPADAVKPPVPSASPDEDLIAELVTAKPEEQETRKGRLQARFGELTSRAKTAEEALARTTAEKDIYFNLLQNRGMQPGQPEPASQPASPTFPAFVPPPAPDPSIYTDSDTGAIDYVKHMQVTVDHAVRTAMAQRDHQEQEARFKVEIQEKGQRFNDLLLRATTAHSDLNTLIAGRPPLSTQAGEAIMALDRESPETAVKVVYFLAQHPEEQAKINQNPAYAGVAIGQIAQRLAAPVIVPNLVSNAPNPATPLAPKETPTTIDINKPNLTTEEYVAATNHPAAAPWLK